MSERKIFIELAEKNASPKAFKKKLGLNLEQVQESLRLLEYHKHYVKTFEEINILMNKRRRSRNPQEKKNLWDRIFHLRRELGEMHRRYKNV